MKNKIDPILTYIVNMVYRQFLVSYQVLDVNDEFHQDIPRENLSIEKYQILTHILVQHL